MFIDFTLANYRSIKDPVTLSAVEVRRGPGTTRQGLGAQRVKTDDDIAPAHKNEVHDLAVLPVLGIFGANASGKSNVIRALHDLVCLARWGTSLANMDIRPFSLDPITRCQPTRFEVRACVDDMVYTYQLEADDERVHRERLDVLPPHARTPRLLFERTWLGQGEESHWVNGRMFAGPHKQLQRSLKPAQLYMSILATHVNVDIAQPFVNWLTSIWLGLTLGEEADDLDFAIRTAHNHEDAKDQILAFVRNFDTGITDFSIEKQDQDDRGRSQPKLEVIVYHETPEGPVSWPLDYESTGTQRLFGLAPKILFCLQLGGAMLVDELGSNIHPLITRRLVELFQSPVTNPCRSQLIFTSHDNTLQRNQLLRRDQVWFTKKNSDGSTDLYPLADYRPRNDLAIDRAYLDGRFGAIPILEEVSSTPVVGRPTDGG